MTTQETQSDKTRDNAPFAGHTLANDYTTVAQLARVSKWLGAIPAFGDSIGTETSKAQLGCAKRIVTGAIEDFATMKDEIAELKASHAALVSALESCQEWMEFTIDQLGTHKLGSRMNYGGPIHKAREALSDARNLTAGMEGGRK